MDSNNNNNNHHHRLRYEFLVFYFITVRSKGAPPLHRIRWNDANPDDMIPINASPLLSRGSILFLFGQKT